MSWRTFDAQTDIRSLPSLDIGGLISILPSHSPPSSPVPSRCMMSDILCRHRATLACPMTIEVDARVGGMGWVAAECRLYWGNGRDAWVTSSTYSVAVISGSAALGILGLPDMPKRPKFDIRARGQERKWMWWRGTENGAAQPLDHGAVVQSGVID
ncbi:uncharacterized protein EV420DRAFT_1477066 [Desarmillaria tabescens]|uniref:Uncharacterized protein n=1 Tax=Armillaria tabescens TaxID=1929756 RepID=A0AA39NB11_ARMTA|nr:uncharacterized protein EV420DRAFT_1477066 [Desarmillaria tabescens]KAK0462320.1 hypothetical protein EV420DRAFT_1477066 [Desarmillaria tabescens]